MNTTRSRSLKTPSWPQLIRTMLPRPVRSQDGLLVGGDPGEVVIRITASEIAVAAFAVEWDEQTPRVAPNGWKIFPVTVKPERVAKAIIKARARRLGTCDWCPECREVKPPEWMSDSICQGCAEKHRVLF